MVASKQKNYLVFLLLKNQQHHKWKRGEGIQRKFTINIPHDPNTHHYENDEIDGEGGCHCAAAVVV